MTHTNKDYDDMRGYVPKHGGEASVLQQGRPAMVTDIRRAVATKHNQIFMLTAESGDIVPTNSGYGIYFRDTCYLDRCEALLNGEPLIPLLTDASAGMESVFELTNDDFVMDNGQQIPKERLSVRRCYTLDEQVVQNFTFQNLAQEALTVTFSLTFATQFLDMFVIRGTSAGQRGTLHPPEVQGHALVFAYDGADQHRRTTTIALTPAPARLSAGTATYKLKIKPGAQINVRQTMTFEDYGPDTASETPADGPVATGQHMVTPASHGDQHRAMDGLLDEMTQIETENPLFERALQRSMDDLRMLITADHGDSFIAAGVPWFVALFGRDSLISAFQILAFQPAIARSTLRVLARYQGTTHDDFRDEDPGKILHELRVGEKANLHEVPQTPYYGTVDATPWFLLLLAEYTRWTGDMSLFAELSENVERALSWIDTAMASGESGFLEYGTRSNKGLANQGWKDSGNSIVNDDGTLAQAPIALIEVQGYVYGAKRGIARLYRHIGNEQRATELDAQAASLKQRVNQAFWMPQKHYYAMAIQQGGRLANAIASNPGQALFTDILDEEKAQALADRLLADDMSSGWGIRTLSALEKAYNPLDYQVGAIWPHDNSLIALGLRRYGWSMHMQAVFDGIFQAATMLPSLRLPEVFDGFSSHQYRRPVSYPVACSPQAWTAGTLPLLVQTALGLEPDALHGALHIHNPVLPPWLRTVTVRNLRVGTTQIDLRYQREGDATLVAVLRRQGKLDIIIEY